MEKQDIDLQGAALSADERTKMLGAANALIAAAKANSTSVRRLELSFDSDERGTTCVILIENDIVIGMVCCHDC